MTNYTLVSLTESHLYRQAKRALADARDEVFLNTYFLAHADGYPEGIAYDIAEDAAQRISHPRPMIKERVSAYIAARAAIEQREATRVHEA